MNKQVLSLIYPKERYQKQEYQIPKPCI